MEVRRTFLEGEKEPSEKENGAGREKQGSGSHFESSKGAGGACG